MVTRLKEPVGHQRFRSVVGHVLRLHGASRGGIVLVERYGKGVWVPLCVEVEGAPVDRSEVGDLLAILIGGDAVRRRRPAAQMVAGLGKPKPVEVLRNVVGHLLWRHSTRGPTVVRVKGDVVGIARPMGVYDVLRGILVVGNDLAQLVCTVCRGIPSLEGVAHRLCLADVLITRGCEIKRLVDIGTFGRCRLSGEPGERIVGTHGPIVVVVGDVCRQDGRRLNLARVDGSERRVA